MPACVSGVGAAGFDDAGAFGERLSRHGAGGAGACRAAQDDVRFLLGRGFEPQVRAAAYTANLHLCQAHCGENAEERGAPCDAAGDRSDDRGAVSNSARIEGRY